MFAAASLCGGKRSVKICEHNSSNLACALLILLFFSLNVNVIISDAINKRSYAGKKPDRYVVPEYGGVVEVQTMNVTRSANWHSCGLGGGKAYSLRIPIVQKYREDKTPYDAATTSQIKEIFEGS